MAHLRCWERGRVRNGGGSESGGGGWICGAVLKGLTPEGVSYRSWGRKLWRVKGSDGKWGG